MAQEKESSMARRLALALSALLVGPLAGAAPALSPGGGAAAPPAQLSDQVVVVVESPGFGETVAGQVVVRGYALDRRASEDAGIRTTPGGVQVWLDRGAGSATGRLLGDAVYGAERPDVAAALGGQYLAVGFAFPWDSCLVPEGRHTLQVFAESTRGTDVEFGFAQTEVVVGACPTPPTPSAVPGSRPLRGQPDWEAILLRTSELRGLAPREELYRAPLTRETYDQRWGAELARYYQSPALDTSRLLLVAFGLLDPGANLADEVRRLQTALPLGVYDAANHVLFVSHDPPDSPLGRVTMAHELTHALQDQHYGWPTRLAQSSPGERERTAEENLALRALLEGDAVIVQRMYQATTIQDPAELARLQAEEAAASAGVDFSRIPYAVYQTTYFPYFYGPTFIYGVLGEGPLTTYGQYGPAIDPLFRDPPVSTSQILHPERYRAGIQPVPVRLPGLEPLLGDEWTRQGEEQQGEFAHRLILDNWLRAEDPDRAAAVASGWTGDRAAVYRRREADGRLTDEVVVVLKTRWESAAAAREWAAAYAETVPLRYQDPVRYAGRTDQLRSTRRLPDLWTWEMPEERGIALLQRDQVTAIAIAPTEALATQLAEYVLAGP
jgi:hypothetical protein